MLNRLLAGLVDASRRHALLVMLAAISAGGPRVRRGGARVSGSAPTPTRCSPTTLPWRRNAIEMAKEFPQFHDLLVAVIDAKEPEEADATAAALAAALAPDHAAFSVGPPARCLAVFR